MSKNKIIDAAIKLFSEQGYYRTNMDDIAKEANVAKGTLYYHFSGKGELFERIVTDGIQMLMDKIEEVLRQNEDPDWQIRTIVSKHIELFLHYGELVHIISNEITNGIEPDILERIVALKNKYIAFVADVLRYGQADGSLNEMHCELAAAGLIGMIQSASLYVIHHHGKGSVDELHETINAFVLPALLKKT
ncbi:TetR family transcriptional regulator [Paenibacillus agaridevorans]|uniref:TetR family transcriptional regulator n=1 Tax=Paenibacillus agaridevorans TaxID=171404 RepID=A0A2R5ER69_9BACL|nr:TetR/AcrR family transcriptional regulator [Paenibacillus agaridevorans]GBG07528.1 TetR family transcriptional regulator [Paenibacillus agaridevorans]